MKALCEAKAGEICFYDLIIPPEDVFRNNFFDDLYRHTLQDIRSQNVFIMSVNTHERYDDLMYGTTTYRFHCIKLAEPDNSILKERLKKEYFKK